MQQQDQRPPDPSAGGAHQQLNQQMLLCPVRLVYETQILVQPGEQIQPNQMIYVNQQNTPPWIQNRAVQNQMLYLPQTPAPAQQNQYIMPQVQQHVDPNQMFIQQNYGQYQQLLPNQMIVRNAQEQMQPIQYQIANLMQQPNMMIQNMQTNVNQTMQAQCMPNYVPITPNPAQNVINVVTMPNTVDARNIATMTSADARQYVTNNVQHSKFVAPAVNIQRPSNTNNKIIDTRQVRPNLQAPNPVHEASVVTQPTIQSQNMIRPPNVSQFTNSNQMQYSQNQMQMKTSSAQVNYPNQSKVATSNISYQVSVANSNMATLNTVPKISQVTLNANQMTSPANIRPLQYSNNSIAHPTVRNHNIIYSPNASPNYRPIQPRPQGHSVANQPQSEQLNFSNSIRNESPVVTHKMPNAFNTFVANVSKPNNVSLTIIPTTVTTESQGNSYLGLNRKRKAQSPSGDCAPPILEKRSSTSVLATQLLQPSIYTPVNTATKYANICKDAAVNTTTATNMDIKSKLKANIIKPIKNTVKTNNEETIKQLSMPLPSESGENILAPSDKLVRNTVFMQARGRLHSDKQTVAENMVSEVKEKTETSITEHKVGANFVKSTESIKKPENTNSEEDKSRVKDMEAMKKTDPLNNNRDMPKLNSLNSAEVMKRLEYSNKKEDKATVNITQSTEATENSASSNNKEDRPNLNRAQSTEAVKPVSGPINDKEERPNLNRTQRTEAIKNSGPLNDKEDKPKVNRTQSTEATKKFEHSYNKEDKPKPSNNKEGKPKANRTQSVESIKKPEPSINKDEPRVNLEEKTLSIKMDKKDSVTKPLETSTETNIKQDKAAVELKITPKNIHEQDLKKKSAIEDPKGQGKDIQPDINVNKDEPYILTHVLDGFVIQESNLAFSIRKPLMERAIYNYGGAASDRDVKPEIADDTPIKEPIHDRSKIFNLTLSEKDNIMTDSVEYSKEKVLKKENPFVDMKSSDLRSWTVEQVTTHLLKHEWTDTAVALSEHEIDGLSLFLATKQQLIRIGVSETHANVICEFVKS